MKVEIIGEGGAGVEKGMLDIALRHHKALNRRCCDRYFGVLKFELQRV